MLLAGRTVGIVGLGAIGSSVARRAKAFDARVLAIRRSYERGSTAPFVDELMGADELDRLLGDSDVVLLSVPATNETTNLIAAPQLATMKRGAILCNVARGALVDEEALVDALIRGQIAAAILDVTKDEPVPADSPLWDVPNLYLSPHSSPSPEGQGERLATLFAENLARYMNGDRLVNERDPNAGY